MSTKNFAAIDFQLKWKSALAEHTDVYHVSDVDFQYDELPEDYAKKIKQLSIGESYSETFLAKDLLGEGHISTKVLRFKAELFDHQFKNQSSPPILYRFYPSAIAAKGLNTSERDYRPFRLISINDDEIVADLNHPLAKYYLTLTAIKVEENKIAKVSNQSKRNITQLLTSKGPGMQTPFEFGEVVFFDQYPFADIQSKMASTAALDSKSREEIANIYSELLPQYSKILDAKSHSSSYLASDYQTGLLVGIGDSEEQLSDNKRLDTYSVQDLNIDTALPYETNSFDDAICTLSIDSFTKPLAIMKEIARVVTSGGKFIITFSNHWQPDQAISLWGQLHPFERMQLVLEYFRFSGDFIDLKTFSKRGIPKDNIGEDASKKVATDSIFAVWGTIK